MLIIPVLDVKGGQVVRARAGLRDSYQPIETPLSPDASIFNVARGLMQLFPFPVLYVADLDAIENSRGFSSKILDALSHLNPRPTIWLDAGFHRSDDIKAVLELLHVRPVLGSESQKDVCLLESYHGEPKMILSLDFRGDEFVGPVELLERTDLWPKQVIAMTLAKVGGNAGPDFDRLAKIRRTAPEHDIIAAGGVRDSSDIEELKNHHIAGALVATSLHNGALTSGFIAKTHGCVDGAPIIPAGQIKNGSGGGRTVPLRSTISRFIRNETAVMHVVECLVIN